MTLPARYRPLFPGTTEQTYLNSCAHGLQSTRARAAAQGFLDQWTRGGDWGAWWTMTNEARKAFARFIGAHEDEVALIPNASAGISAIASALDFRGERNEVVTTALDFPSAPYVWNEQAPRGAKHVHLPWNDGLLRVDQVRPHLGPRTKLLSIPHVASFNGYKLDAKAFTAAAHEAGALAFVDGFQAAGTFPINVKDLDVDFYVTGTYKWLLGVSGTAFLYVKRELHQELRPTVGGWLAQDDPYGFNPLAPPAKDARRYQGGGANILGSAVAIEGFNLLNEAGLANVQAHNLRLCDRIMEAADARGFQVLTPRAHADRGSIVTFRVPRLTEVLGALAAHNVVVNQRLEGLRVSPHFYNTEADVDQLFAVIDRTLRA
ncbi:MAG TPA: aminotransferase class V-fold PLP-dependent enzyme [Candidatus Thermoplasmatota archaeon]|nr:aminotransferase class V-fold PLP-dependent enzyme [Candidatus Thermoplasmatota archaeon]